MDFAIVVKFTGDLVVTKFPLPLTKALNLEPFCNASLEAYNISFSMKRLLPGLPSLQRNDVEIQFEVVFILLCNQAQSIKSHFQWVTSLDSYFPSYLFFPHPTVRALNLVLFIPPIRRGIFRLLYRVFL